MIAVIGALAWEFPVSLPLMASKVFGGGAAACGVMASVMGVGAVAGGLVAAGRGRPRASALCLSAIGWGIAILLAAVAPTMPLELAALVFVGYGSITFNSMAKTVLQLAAKPTMRGRVMALWGTGLARVDPDRRLHRRLDRPGRGRPLVARGRRPAHAPLRPPRPPCPHPHRPPPRRGPHTEAGIS
jgi:Transmembrane secretion effector